MPLLFLYILRVDISTLDYIIHHIDWNKKAPTLFFQLGLVTIKYLFIY